MSQLDDGTYVTDLDNDADNGRLLSLGYTIRHIESWERQGVEDTVVFWDAPEFTDADIPY